MDQLLITLEINIVYRAQESARYVSADIVETLVNSSALQGHCQRYLKALETGFTDESMKEILKGIIIETLFNHYRLGGSDA